MNKEQLTDEQKLKQVSAYLSDAVARKKNATIIVKKGEAHVDDSLFARLGSRTIAGIGATGVMILLIVLINEAFGWIRVKGKTPLTLIREL